jgi:hypothetical protein
VLADPEVGPDGTVGACRFSILCGNPISGGTRFEEFCGDFQVYHSLVLAGCGGRVWVAGLMTSFT